MPQMHVCIDRCICAFWISRVLPFNLIHIGNEIVDGILRVYQLWQFYDFLYLRGNAKHFCKYVSIGMWMLTEE